MSQKNQKHREGLSGGVRFGVPPKKGPNPQGINVNNNKKKNKTLLK